MKPISLVLMLSLLATAATWRSRSTSAVQENVNAPHYSAEHRLLRPENYREWVYVSSGLGMNYAPVSRGAHAMAPVFTNVFVNPESYRDFIKTGRWPDKTIFALELYSSADRGSILQSGHYQQTFLGLEAEVKDASTPEVWRYYGFGVDRPEAEAFPKAMCFNCHEQNAFVEHSFVQFYPRLLDVAIAHKTLNPGKTVPVSRTR
jgi:Cytochrome P460